MFLKKIKSISNITYYLCENLNIFLYFNILFDNSSFSFSNFLIYLSVVGLVFPGKEQQKEFI